MTQPSNPSELEQSPRWDKLKDIEEGDEIPGFPYDEGFPMGGARLPSPVYELICRYGDRAIGIVDYSTQYRAEGPNWQILHPPKWAGYMGRHVVAAWRERPPEEA